MLQIYINLETCRQKVQNVNNKAITFENRNDQKPDLQTFDTAYPLFNKKNKNICFH